MAFQEELTSIMERLRALVLAPPFVYRDTPAELIEKERARASHFEGLTALEVAQIERELSLELPRNFREFLLAMGRSRGDLLCGSDFGADAGFAKLRKEAEELIRATPGAASLPDDAIVFLFHQGYAFAFVRATGADDSPVYEYAEGEMDARQIAPSFASFLLREIAEMERSCASFRARGGYYRTLYPDGSGMEHFPALDSGDRPLEATPPKRRWWELWK